MLYTDPFTLRKRRLCPWCGSGNIEKAAFPSSSGYDCRTCAFHFEKNTRGEGAIIFGYSGVIYFPARLWIPLSEWELEREEARRRDDKN